MYRFLRFSSLLLLFAFLSTFPNANAYTYYVYDDMEGAFNDDQSLQPVEPRDYPILISGETVSQLSAQGIYIVDVDSAVPLYDKNSRERLYPASTTKIMTALIARETFELNDVLSATQKVVEGSKIKLKKGERMSVSNLLRGLLIQSGNDAAETLAESYPGGRGAFVDRMNQKAQDLRLYDTRFSNPTGLPGSDHFSTPRDLAHLTRYALQDEFLKEIVAIRQTTVSGTNGEKHLLRTTNTLLGQVKGLDGFKTGYTDEAGEVLISTVERDQRRVVIALLKSNDRFGETRMLLDWVYSNFSWKQPYIGFQRQEQ